MKLLLLGWIVISSASCASVTAITDLSGKWLIKQDRDLRGNPGVAVECTFTQERATLTVRCGDAGNSAGMKGEIRDRIVTWGLEKTGIAPVTDDRLTLVYRAEIDEAGTKMNGVWRLTSSVLNEKGNFEAVRQ
jgi:hypothetical protein